MGPRSKKTYYYIVGAIFSVIAVVIICQFILAISETKSTVFKTEQEYLDLFNDTTKKQLTTGASYNSTVRNSIATLRYDKRKYSLVIYKIPTVLNFNLSSISVTKTDKISAAGVYSVAQNDGYLDLNYIAGGQEIAKKIKLSYKGNDS